MAAELGPLVGARSLAEIPVHRQEGLLRALRRSYPEVDVADLDTLIAALSATPCRLRLAGPVQEMHAVLGDDGRYHVVIDGLLKCGSNQVPRPVPVEDGRLERRGRVVPHRQRCVWWTDGARYLTQVPQQGPWSKDQWHEKLKSWKVRLVPCEVARPELIRPRLRCAPTSSAGGLWPTLRDRSTAKGRIRARLVDELGQRCHACGGAPGTEIDHAHERVELVRGLVCRHCNSTLDGCLHLSGCVWAAYLDHPPAAHLGLRYPL